jgi:hypothetical protein
MQQQQCGDHPSAPAEQLGGEGTHIAPVSNGKSQVRLARVCEELCCPSLTEQVALSPGPQPRNP